MPRVSVVLIFLNEERFLEEAVQSVRDQRLGDFELILVDDGSTDRSTLIARELAASDDKIRYVDHPGHENCGMSASRNLGVAHATAPCIAFLDADDVWMPDKLSEQVDLLDNMPDVAMVVGAIQYWYSWAPGSTKADRDVLTGGMADRRLEPPEALLALHPLGPASGAGVTGVVRRSAFDAVGGFEVPFRGLFEDQAFLAKIFLRYPIYISSRCSYRYRQHDTSCVGRTSRTDHLRLRGAYLAWLEKFVGPHGDERVVAAVRRARRELPYRRLTAPAYEMYDRFPEELKGRLRALTGRSVE
ncbi:glycosyl transferase [Mycobacterium sp. JS623]|uniref:glycosyltransferase family 2 protein n=1 Tax=Mycobacterium sp. JS623 TaxID=212767 RepID=UPI0002A584EC|nr:glycosyltransferase family 2 protein [Mycobacterium sp. JS623]AGB21357.1 glycosyl transferase [Mycobacterium sp. JS623]